MQIVKKLALVFIASAVLAGSLAGCKKEDEVKKPDVPAAPKMPDAPK